jgi:hypothetical protein
MARFLSVAMTCGPVPVQAQKVAIMMSEDRRTPKTGEIARIAESVFVIALPAAVAAERRSPIRYAGQ